MKKNTIILFFILISLNIIAQESSFGQRLEVEANFMYYRELDNNLNEFYNELSLSPSFNVNLTDRFYLGVRTYIVRPRSPVSPVFSSWHTLIGPTVKYHIINKNRLEFNVEAGYFYGNYCPNCTPDDEYYNASLHYIGLLLDLSFQVFEAIPRLWFKASFATNNSINIIKLNGYNLPLFGVQYKFGKLKNE